MYKAFLRPFLIYASSGWFPFLSVTNLTKLKHLYRAAACRRPLSHFSSLRLLYLPHELFSLISPCHLMSGPFVPQPPFPFEVWPDLEQNQDSADSPREL